MKFGACAGSGESWSLGSVSSVLVFEGDGEPDQRRRPSPAIFMKKKKKKKGFCSWLASLKRQPTGNSSGYPLRV